MTTREVLLGLFIGLLEFTYIHTPNCPDCGLRMVHVVPSGPLRNTLVSFLSMSRDTLLDIKNNQEKVCQQTAKKLKHEMLFLIKINFYQMPKFSGMLMIWSSGLPGFCCGVQDFNKDSPSILKKLFFNTSSFSSIQFEMFLELVPVKHTFFHQWPLILSRTKFTWRGHWLISKWSKMSNKSHLFNVDVSVRLMLKETVLLLTEQIFQCTMFWWPTLQS